MFAYFLWMNNESDCFAVSFKNMENLGLLLP